MDVKSAKQLSEDVTTGKKKSLELSDSFKFKCTMCGACCFNNDVIINPYDNIRLRHGLKLPTQEIFKRNLVNFYIGPSSGLPVLTIGFKEVSKNLTKCPFLVPTMNVETLVEKVAKGTKFSDEMKKEMMENYKKNPEEFQKDIQGLKPDKWICRIHKDRPMPCRLYPCGRIIKIDPNDKSKSRDYIFLQDEQKTCPGLRENFSQTLQQFLDNGEFWHYKAGSATSQLIMEKLITTGFFEPTFDNGKQNNKSVLKKDSPVLNFIGNLVYNFDSFNAFSKDPRVIKTIYDDIVTQEDFMYVANKILVVLSGFVDKFKGGVNPEVGFQDFIKSITTKGGDKS